MFKRLLIIGFIIALVPHVVYAHWQPVRYAGGSLGMLAGGTLCVAGVSELAAMNYCKPAVVEQMSKEGVSPDKFNEIYSNIARGHLYSIAMLVVGSAMLYGNYFYVLP